MSCVIAQIPPDDIGNLMKILISNGYVDMVVTSKPFSHVVNAVFNNHVSSVVSTTSRPNTLIINGNFQIVSRLLLTNGISDFLITSQSFSDVITSIYAEVPNMLPTNSSRLMPGRSFDSTDMDIYADACYSANEDDEFGDQPSAKRAFYDKHQRICRGDCLQQCSHCHKHFLLPNFTAHHILSHVFYHLNDSFRYQCKTCSQTWNSQPLYHRCSKPNVGDVTLLEHATPELIELAVKYCPKAVASLAENGLWIKNRE